MSQNDQEQSSSAGSWPLEQYRARTTGGRPERWHGITVLAGGLSEDELTNWTRARLLARRDADRPARVEAPPAVDAGGVPPPALRIARRLEILNTPVTAEDLRALVNSPCVDRLVSLTCSTMG